MINVFFDTEFTTLAPLVEPKLISLGCVTEDGREFYAELTDTYKKSDCSDFTIEAVLPFLQCGEAMMMEAQCALRLKDWVDGLDDQEVVFRSDAPGIDWPFISQLFDHYDLWPHTLRRKCESIYFEDEARAQRFKEGVVDFWKVYVHKPHHSLTDARSLVSGWWYAQAKEMSDTQFANLLDAFMQFGLNDGDIGYSYWWGMRQKLQELRNRR